MCCMCDGYGCEITCGGWGRGGTSISPLLKATRAAISSSTNSYDLSSYCGFTTQPPPPLGDTNLFGHPLFGMGLCSSHTVVVVKYSQQSMGLHTIVGVVLQLVAVLLCQDAMVHFENSGVDELSQHGNVLQKGFIRGDLLQGIMGWATDSQPSLLSFCFSGNGRVGTLVKVLASIPVVEVCCVVHNGLPSLHARFSAPPEVSNNGLNAWL